MSNFFDRLLGRTPQRSAQSAKERLQLVLVHDRTDISPAVMEVMKDEIIAVISKHIEIDRGGVEINVSKDNNSQKIVANIPLLSGQKRRRPR